MASYGMNDVKNGMKIIVDGYPSTIVDTEYVKPGKGQAFTRVKYKNLKSGRTVELTMKSTDSLEAADVVDTDLEYLYSDGEFWHFMHPDIARAARRRQERDRRRRQVAQGQRDVHRHAVEWRAAHGDAADFVELLITETDPGVKGDTAGSGGKPATLETGAVVRVPLFVPQGDKIKVDTRTGEYVSRVK